MKIIKPSVEFFGAVPTEYNAALKFTEKCGRVCYKSEDKITEDSAEGFVKKLIKAGHLAMVEHSNFVVRNLDSSYDNLQYLRDTAGKYLTVIPSKGYTVIGGSLTAWYQRCLLLGRYEGMFNAFFHIWGKLFGLDTVTFSHSFGEVPLSNWEVCPHDEIPKALHRYSAKFICDRGVSHELVRHRPCSFAQESTRYVNYGGKDMEFIEPDGFERWRSPEIILFRDCCRVAEDLYNKCLDCDLKPQQARGVLPNALKTEIVVTADAAEWMHIRKLRTAKSSHPDMQRVMNMMPWEEFL